MTRRQDEWEREIETLDQKEMELHQSQLRLIREQTAIFIRDLAALQGEVAALKEGLTSNGTPLTPLQNDFKEQKAKLLAQEQLTVSIQKRVDFLERLLGESVDRHAQEIESAKTAQARLAGEAKAREAHHASVADRLGYIEQLVGDSFDRHSKEIQSSHSRLESLHARLAACESQAGQNSLRERVDFLEKLLGESSQKHAEAATANQVAHEANLERLQHLHGSFQDQISSRMEKLHGSIQERLERLEHQLRSECLWCAWCRGDAGLACVRATSSNWQHLRRSDGNNQLPNQLPWLGKGTEQWPHTPPRSHLHSDPGRQMFSLVALYFGRSNGCHSGFASAHVGSLNPFTQALFFKCFRTLVREPRAEQRAETKTLL
ncbi:unnamed protein product [Symbiodinium natans]|uniref:Uncharacterized protein n=1 Tax=Symbiodinium natans TaxID=878477 RepID=A0A812T6D5_9DINO|nr:unnamed protein product [Symbiodinium natans]